MCYWTEKTQNRESLENIFIMTSRMIENIYSYKPFSLENACSESRLTLPYEPGTPVDQTKKSDFLFGNGSASTSITFCFEPWFH